VKSNGNAKISGWLDSTQFTGVYASREKKPTKTFIGVKTALDIAEKTCKMSVAISGMFAGRWALMAHELPSVGRPS
jgi:hypothetical protein